MISHLIFPLVLYSLHQDPSLCGWCCSSVDSWWWESSSSCSTSSLDLFKSCKCCHRLELMELWYIFTLLTVPLSTAAVLSPTNHPDLSVLHQTSWVCEGSPAAPLTQQFLWRPDISPSAPTQGCSSHTCSPSGITPGQTVGFLFALISINYS